MSIFSQFTPRQVPIPERFRRSDDLALFSSCQVCEASLIEPPRPYMIEKAIRRYPQYDVEEILFEYALCLRCYRDLSQRLSSESTLRLQQFMEQRTRLGDRAREMLDQYPDDPDAWLDQCIVEGQPLKESREYTICAQAMGDQLILGVMPYGLSASAMDEMTTLLSAKTQDAFDDFRDNHVGGPPDVNEWLRERKRPVLI